MKTEIKDIAVGAVAHVPGVSTFLSTGQLAIVGLTILLLLVQIVYYITKWVREYTPWGVRMRRWAERRGITKPAELDE